MKSVTFTGRQFRLVLGVGGYEFEEATNFDDKNCSLAALSSRSDRLTGSC